MLDGMSGKKRGPKGVLKNPRPVEQRGTGDDGSDVCVGTTDEIGPGELDWAERTLRAYFRKRSKELVARQGEALQAAVGRITRLATDALSETNAVWWSGYQIERTVDNPAALEPPSQTLPTSGLARPWNPPSLRRISRPWGKSRSTSSEMQYMTVYRQWPSLWPVSTIDNQAVARVALRWRQAAKLLDELTGCLRLEQPVDRPWTAETAGNLAASTREATSRARCSTGTTS